MLLSGTGGFIDGRWRFAGRAEAAPGHEKDLANFLNLLGETRREGDKEVISLQFQ
jgi:general secretion pathway protein N